MRSNSVKFDISPIKRSFYAACNSICSHSHGVKLYSLTPSMKWHYWHSRNHTVYLYCCMRHQHCHLRVNRSVSQNNVTQEWRCS